MKFAIPEISWHNRDPVLSVDVQPRNEATGHLRLATGGTDSHVLIWYILTTETGSVNLEVAADLTRHQKAVNVVRWSPNGQFLASGDDESIIFIWKLKTDEKEPSPTPYVEGEEQYKETWTIHKTLRGHMEDVLDISWSPNSAQLASGSVDNKLLLWDVTKGRYSSILTDHKGFVQGVAWDPKDQLIASASTDRVFRTFDVTTKKVVSRSSKASLPFPSNHPLHNVRVRLYHDDTLQTYYRRLQFSPDGLLIAVPAGKIEPEQGKIDSKPINAVYIYTRYSLKVPACILPCGEPALACRWCPRRFAPRPGGPEPAFPMPSRMVLAVATKRSVILYDTQQKTPLALISNIHYTRLTDLTWSADGQTLVASSTDGFCSVIMFSPGELGDVLPDEDTQQTSEPMDVQSTESSTEATAEKVSEISKTGNTLRIDSFIKFKTPSEKSPTKQKTDLEQKTPVKIDVLMETAMSSWSDNSSNEIIKPRLEPMEVENNKTDNEVVVIEDSEDLKLIYDETQTMKGDASNQKCSKPAAGNSLEKDGNLNRFDQITGELKTDTNQSNTLTESNKSEESAKLHSSSSTKKSPRSALKQFSNNEDFLKQAKVTDVKEPVAVKTISSPKAPRRVSFVTLSSPKNSKKKC